MDGRLFLDRDVLLYRIKSHLLPLLGARTKVQISRIKVKYLQLLCYCKIHHEYTGLRYLYSRSVLNEV